MLRKTDSFLPPVKNNRIQLGQYNIYPAFEVNGVLYSELDTLCQFIAESGTVVIDGYEGVFWDKFISSLKLGLDKLNCSTHFVNVAESLKSENDIDILIQPFMGKEDSIFGRMTNLRLIDFFDRSKLHSLKPYSGCDVNIIYGCGAALADWNGPVIYVDLPKNELQFRMAAKKAYNIGSTKNLDSREYYKRCYFIDWPILDEYKGNLIPRLSWIVDEQRIDVYTYMNGDVFRDALEEMCHNSFRVRPWFAPGVWGGNYLRDHIKGLNRNVDNLAWSYELMALENGIMFSHDNILMEVSFSFLMSFGYKKILGSCADDFGTDFPIRFDFLDTINGGNLSIQCHPRPEYTRSRFGKKFTQDETYYILRSDGQSKVYLGFQDDIKKEEFSKALIESQNKKEKLNITRFVQAFPSKKHDLFLIPNGTIHASGSGNLVLEISSAPYIFTFKMYDWVRLDIDGRPRPINIEHGLNNVRFERKGHIVSDELISKAYVMDQDQKLLHEHLPTHREHFYDIERYTIHDGYTIDIQNNNKCHVWMIVEGSYIDIQIKNGRKESYSYLETFIVPAAAKEYSLINNSGNDVILVKAFVKDHFTI